MPGSVVLNRIKDNRQARVFAQRRLEAILLRGLVTLAAGITLACFVGVVGYTVLRGLPHIHSGMFALDYNSTNMSVLPSILSTLLIVGVGLLIAAPVGIFGAVYLVEYAPRGSRLAAFFRLTTETLSGIPSIVYGLFGMLFFVFALDWDYSILAGAFTVGIMVLPTMIRSTEEALKAVPDSYREASFGLGAGKVRTIFKIILPSAVPGILSGVILSIGRIVGETAALKYTAGTVAELPGSLMDSGSSLAVLFHKLAGEGLHMENAYATAVILLLVVLAINTLAGWIAKKLRKDR